MLKPSVQIHHENGTLLAEFWDCLRLDLGAVQDLKTKYEDHLKAGGRPHLVVDLLGVGFAGSAALGYFVGLQRIARAKNGRVVFCNVDPTVFEVFRVSKLDSLFSFVPDRAAALALTAGSEATADASEVKSAAGAGAGTAVPAARSSGSEGALKGRRGRKLS